MELMGNFKDKVSKAKSKEEAKGIIESADMRLTEDELDKVSGGMDIRTPTGHGRGEFDCQIEPNDTGDDISPEPTTYIHS